MAAMLTPAAALPRRRSGRTSARSRKDTNGSARTRSALSTEEIETVGVDRAPHPEDDDDDGETDRDFGDGDRDREDGEQQADGIAVQPREGDEVDGDRVQHQLDPEEDPDGVAPREHAEQPDREHKGGDDQVRG